MAPFKIKRTLDIVRNIVKYGILAVSFLGVLHCFLLYIGHDIVWIHLGLCIFGLFFGFYLSKLFGLCWIHKLNICYIIAVLTCIVLRRHGFFESVGIDIHIARGVMCLIGIIIQLLTFYKLRGTNCKDCDDCNFFTNLEQS